MLNNYIFYRYNTIQYNTVIIRIAIKKQLYLQIFDLVFTNFRKNI